MEKHFILNYYKNADCGIHIQKISDSSEAQKTHSHGYFQIYYILQGSLTHMTERESSRLSRGDAFIIPPNRTHSISNLENALFYTVSFAEESLSGASGSLLLIHRFLESLRGGGNLHARIEIKNEQISLVENLLDKLLSEFDGKEIGYGDTVRAYLTIVLTILARAHFEKVPLTMSESHGRERIAACMAYIDENYAEPLALSDMAKWCAMSKSEFCKQFYNMSGATFSHYLNSVRIRRAVKLLESNHSITSVQILCGYNDFSTLYRNFKKIMGCSPLQYRKQRICR
jgi:AraC-like DNA-binding protein